MRRAIVPVLFLLASFPALSLDLGDKALPISPAKWITGSERDPLKTDGKQFFVVEVWSVTCPPCVRSIPKLNELQRKYAGDGLAVVSFTTDKEEDVVPFLKENPIEYSSFIDKDNETYVKYMAADNRDTIPHAFVFDRSGALVWIGNPLDDIEGVVKKVVSGALNAEVAAKIKAGREELQAAFAAQDPNGMIEAVKKLEEVEPDNSQYYQIHLQLLSQLGGEGDISALMRAWYKGCADNAGGLAMLSVMALEQGPMASRDPAMALAAARRAFEISGEGEGGGKFETGITLAEIYRSVGRVDLAVATLKSLESESASAEEKEMLKGVTEFFLRVQEASKNPDAPYNP